MSVTTRHRRTRLAPVGLAVAALALVAVFPIASASAAPTGATGGSGAAGASGPVAPKPVVVRLKNHVPFTDTGITLKVGDKVAITTSGTMTLGGGFKGGKTPVGIPWGPRCEKVFVGKTGVHTWPAPGLRCWSMIGKIGNNPPFEVGVARTFRATDAGMLTLGVNDNFTRDDNGHWFATIKVNAPGALTTPAASSKKKSSTILYVLIGALLLLVILLVIVVSARRRGNDKEAPEPAEPALVGAAVAAPTVPFLSDLEETAPSAAPTGAAPLPESIDVNIFDVEFSNGLTMRVGYNHFPEGVDLRWKVTQNRIPVATGRFATQGGGSTNHYETVTLGVKLEGRDTQPEGADVQFDWTVNDVPFRYSVRRDPNC